jgi:hypothetical protein
MSSLNNPISTGQVFSRDFTLANSTGAGALSVAVSVAESNFSSSSQVLGIKRIALGAGVLASGVMPNLVVTPPIAVVANAPDTGALEYKLGMASPITNDLSTYTVYWTNNVAQSAPCPLNPNGLLSPA